MNKCKAVIVEENECGERFVPFDREVRNRNEAVPNHKTKK